MKEPFTHIINSCEASRSVVECNYQNLSYMAQLGFIVTAGGLTAALQTTRIGPVWSIPIALGVSFIGCRVVFGGLGRTYRVQFAEYNKIIDLAKLAKQAEKGEDEVKKLLKEKAKVDRM